MAMRAAQGAIAKLQRFARIVRIIPGDGATASAAAETAIGAGGGECGRHERCLIYESRRLRTFLNRASLVYGFSRNA
jgi:hypothetical protein